MDVMTRADDRVRTDDRVALADRWPVRLVGVALLAAITVIHLEDISGKFEETPYLGVGYVLLIAGCAVAAMLLVRSDRGDHRLGWALAGGLAALTLLGFVLTRTTGLPQATDDKGNWHETLGVWSIITEGALVVLSTACLATSRRADPALS
jgi:hypothetical protein